MRDFGEYLKKVRNEKGFSLNKVYERTGITDSRLSKAENGSWNILKIEELKSLAQLYEISVVSLCLMASIFNETDLKEYHSCFQNVELLDQEEKKHIQLEIDFIIRMKNKTD